MTPLGDVASGRAALQYLADAQDRHHSVFGVYEDVSSPGNHFHALGKIPSTAAAATMQGAWTVEPRAGATAIRCEFVDVPGVANHAGFYFLNGVLTGNDRAPRPNFGSVPAAGVDLRGATRLMFWARGERGGERIDFFVAGVGRDAQSGQPVASHPDSSRRHPEFGSVFTLAREWRRYTIDVRGLDLSYVLGGFAWVADDRRNPGGAVFYLDDITYELSAGARDRRLAEPRFLVSFETLPRQPDPFDEDPADDFDLVFRNTAFSYDNALAVLAFVAGGTADDLRRARLVADAFVYAQSHDRHYDDGRLRTAYAAGDLVLPPGWEPNGKRATVAIPGFYYEPTQTFTEVEQRSIDTGNNAWVMMALLAVHRRTGDPRYLHAARRIGELIRGFRADDGRFRGFRGGLDDAESSRPSRRPWASAEHNLDVFAAFRSMAERTGEPSWDVDADHARELLDALWQPELGCYLAGTLDPEHLNDRAGQLPLDVQAWSVLALPGDVVDEARVLACAETHHRTRHAGFTGYDFNDDRDCVWFEGTAQMALATALADDDEVEARRLLTVLQRAQATPPFGAAGGLAAATCDGLTTGFGFAYFVRRHVGATAWQVFAQLGFNPYYQTYTPCDASDRALCTERERFRVNVSWRTLDGRAGAGVVAPLRTDDSGIFWFFSEDNWELLVKVLDGCAFNDRFWVFAAAATAVELDLLVTDTLTGATRLYHNPLGQPARPVADTDAFAGCTASSDRFAARAPEPGAPTRSSVTTSGACPADELCLGERYRARLDWRKPDGEAGVGTAVPGTTDTGLFWFFSPHNWEMLVKVLDGCAINGHRWVFAAATTNVEFTLTVEDVESTRTRSYRNPLGVVAETVTDTAAFSCD